MNAMNICIDIDGTVTDAYYWLKSANEHFDLSVTPDEVIVYEIHQVLGVDLEDYDQFYQQFGVKIHREAKMRPGASAVIQRLYRKHQIHFVTARAESMRRVSMEWLDRHQIPMDSISLLASHDKVNKAQLLNCDLFIEDRYENAIQLARAGLNVLLINCSYNQGPLPQNARRVSSWREISRLVDEMERMQFPALVRRLSLAEA